MHAGSVVLAAGAWSGDVRIDAATSTLPVRPVRGQLLHLGWTDSPPARITWDEHCYVVPWQNGTVLVGATVEDVGFDERSSVGGVKGLLESVCDLLPHASNAQLLSARAGIRPSTRDGLPVIGWSQAVEGLMYATGHYRSGILLAPLTAAIVADAIVDGIEPEAFAITTPARFGHL
jgi:glycine oxidase